MEQGVPRTARAEIITLVEQSPLSLKATLRELGINRSTFYECGAARRYKRYLSDGFDGLADQPYRRTSAWNQLPSVEKSRIVELALERPDLSCRELACHIVGNEHCGAARAVCVGIDRIPSAEKSGTDHYASLSVDGSD